MASVGTLNGWTTRCSAERNPKLIAKTKISTMSHPHIPIRSTARKDCFSMMNQSVIEVRNSMPAVMMLRIPGAARINIAAIADRRIAKNQMMPTVRLPARKWADPFSNRASNTPTHFGYVLSFIIFSQQSHRPKSDLKSPTGCSYASAWDWGCQWV